MMPKHEAHTSLSSGFASMLFVSMIGCCLVASAAFGAQADPEAVGLLIRSLDGLTASEPPLLYQQEDGFVKFIGAPSQGRFVVPSAGKSSDEEGLAQQFMQQHEGAFGLDHPEMSLTSNKIVHQGGNAFVRLDQHLGAYPVFGAQVVVHLAEDLSVHNVMADVMRDTETFDKRLDAFTPVFSAAEAIELARTLNAALSDNINIDDFTASGEPELVVFHPALFSMSGETALAWKVRLAASAPFPRVVVLLVDAQTGEMLFRYAENASARWREVYNANFSQDFYTAPLVRREGDPATGDSQADDLYDYLGDCYDFYMNQHGRDSYDDKGSPLRGYYNFPEENAYYVHEEKVMLIGEGYLADDVGAHEYTHAVTQYSANLIYFSYSGAINEMFSDIFGEFVDLTNGRGNDAPEMRWFAGEDLDLRYPDQRGMEDEADDVDEIEEPLPGIRYMKDPTVFGDPDRLDSPLVADPYSWYDLGGVHINCGIGNKLAYLLTDGDTFNNQTVKSMGIPRVADLFYEARPLLGSSANYYDLYYALRAASIMLGFSMEERENVVSGMRAVAIEPPEAYGIEGIGFSAFRATTTKFFNNAPAVSLTWTNPNIGDSFESQLQVNLFKSPNAYPTGTADGEILPVSKNNSAYLDAEVNAGITYYYTLVGSIGGVEFQRLYAKAVAGTAAPAVLTEVFGQGLYLGNNPFDLSNTQITFRPVGAPPASLSSVVADASYDAYEATLTRGVYQLPVEREDAQFLPMPDNGGVPLYMPLRPFPFFGRLHSTAYLSSNGYIIFTDVNLIGISSEFNDFMDTPSLAAHFTLPRLSFMFADLMPNLAGQVWHRELADRSVVCFMDVPVKTSDQVLNPERVTVQVECFDSGQIRITYLSANISSGIVGLSDGRGVPRDPADEFDGVYAAIRYADLSSLPDKPTRLSIEPIAPSVILGGEVASFTATVLTPETMSGTPSLFAEWDGPGAAPFVDAGDGTGQFLWETNPLDAGVYVVRVKAQLGAQRAFQDVRVVVGNVTVKPEARNLAIATDTPAEDPTANRPVAVGRPLIASYDYFHPHISQMPLLYDAGQPLLYWFRNGQIAPAFTNVLMIPAYVPKVGDDWWFQVTPITVTGIWGDSSASPVVTVMGAPDVLEVRPNTGLTTGGQRVTIRGEHLKYPLSIKFGAVPGRDIQAISDTEVSVTIPSQAAGKVTLFYETPGGVGRLVDGFTYVGDMDDDEGESEEIKADKKKKALACGAAPGGGRTWAGDLFVLGAAAGLLLFGTRRARTNQA